MDPTSALGQWLASAVLAPSAAETSAAAVYRTCVPSGSAHPPPLEAGALPAEIAAERCIILQCLQTRHREEVRKPVY